MTTSHPPDALRRTTAAKLRAAVQGGRAPHGVGLGLLSLAALLERRTPFDGADVDALQAAVRRLLDVLLPGRPAVAGAAVPLRFARPEPVWVRR